jgi:hypothetical protein
MINPADIEIYAKKMFEQIIWSQKHDENGERK